jgi:hypothetical protein
MLAAIGAGSLARTVSRKGHTLMTWRFPMPMTIRCYECGKVFEVTLTSTESHDFPCPACGKIEVFDLGAWEKKAIAWSAKMIRKSGRGR